MVNSTSDYVHNDFTNESSQNINFIIARKLYLHTLKRSNDIYSWLLEIPHLVMFEMSGTCRKAPCPLCGASGNSYIESDNVGYAIPRGLTNHLLGNNRAQICPIVELALATKRRIEPPTNTEVKEINEQRRIFEEGYYIDPSNDNKVLFEEIPLDVKNRNRSQFEFAETRLQTLGFKKVTECRGIKYSLIKDDYIVFADLRMENNIHFNVGHENKGFRNPKLGSIYNTVGEFTISDKTIKTLKKSFDKKLESTISDYVSRMD